MAGYDLQIGSAERAIRPEVIDFIVKQKAGMSYKFKQAVAVVPTMGDKNTFYREDPTTRTGSGPSGNKFKGVPFGSNFPFSETAWEELNVRTVAFKVESNIPYETWKSSGIDIVARTIAGRTEELTKQFDDYAWDQLTENRTGTGYILSFAVNNIVGGLIHGRWDQTSAAIIEDLSKAKRLISEYGYDVSDLIAFVTPSDAANIMSYLAQKGAQWNSLAQDIAVNGSIGKVAGITIVESNSVTASYALVVKPKTCATFYEFQPLTTNSTEDPGKSWRFRAWFHGAIGLHEPRAICLIGDLKTA